MLTRNNKKGSRFHFRDRCRGRLLTVASPTRRGWGGHLGDPVDRILLRERESRHVSAAELRDELPRRSLAPPPIYTTKQEARGTNQPKRIHISRVSAPDFFTPPPFHDRRRESDKPACKTLYTHARYFSFLFLFLLSRGRIFSSGNTQKSEEP